MEDWESSGLAQQVTDRMREMLRESLFIVAQSFEDAGGQYTGEDVARAIREIGEKATTGEGITG